MRVWRRALAVTVALGVLWPLNAAVAAPQSQSQVMWARSNAVDKIYATEKSTPLGFYPYFARNGSWSMSTAYGWTSGYFMGQLWLINQLSDSSWYRSRAAVRQQGIGDLRLHSTNVDIGQRYFYSYAKAYDMTGKTSYRDEALSAAKYQAARFNPTVGALRSWNATDCQKVIIDDLMNAQLLFWAARHGGPSSYATIAHQHALTVARDFVREDGSTYHLIRYNEASGTIIETTTAQGFSADSMWARGQAWGIYGFATAFRETQDPVLLEAARKVADRYLADLPADHVPYWDFRAPDIPLAPRDSSAAAVAASGLLELARVETDTARAATYTAEARETLSSLSSGAYLSAAKRVVLDHGTLNFHSRTQEVGLSFGDYFYLEALLRLRLVPSLEATTAYPVSKMAASKENAYRAVDGSLNTAWTVKGKKWIQMDLGSSKTLHAVTVAIVKGTTQSAGLEIKISSDKKHWRSVLHSRTSAATNGPERFEITPRSARYVRVYVNGTTRNKYIGISDIRAY